MESSYDMCCRYLLTNTRGIVQSGVTYIPTPNATPEGRNAAKAAEQCSSKGRSTPAGFANAVDGRVPSEGVLSLGHCSSPAAANQYAKWIADSGSAVLPRCMRMAMSFHTCAVGAANCYEQCFIELCASACRRQGQLACADGMPYTLSYIWYAPTVMKTDAEAPMSWPKNCARGEQPSK